MLARNLQHGARRLARQPGFTLVAVLCLGLGIGANTAIFSLLEGVVLKPLAYPHAERIVGFEVSAPERGIPHMEMSRPRFYAIAEGSPSLAAMAAWVEEPMSLSERGDPQMVGGARITSGFFDVWGVEPILGHRFSPAEDKKGGGDVVLLSEGFWRRRYAGSPGVLGRALRIDGRSYTVVGVMPGVLRFPFAQAELWVPRPDEVAFLSETSIEGGSSYLVTSARLRPGATLARAREEVAAANRGYAERRAANIDAPFHVEVQPMNERLVGPLRGSLVLLLGAVAFVLLIACADVGNLLLAQGLARRREMAIRLALGAGRSAVVRQLLAEGALLALAGGLVGLALAAWGLRLLVLANPADLPRLAEVGIDGRVLAFTLAAALAAGLVFSLAPALQVARGHREAAPALARGSRGSAGGGVAGNRAQGIFIAAEVALAATLLIGAGLLVQSLRRLAAVDLGFEPRRISVVEVSLPFAKYPDVESRRVFFEQALERVRQIPGVAAAGLSDYVPGTPAPHTPITPEEAPAPDLDHMPLVWRKIVAPGTLRTLGAWLVAGRDFSSREAADGPLSAIVNRTLARQLFGERPAVGKRLILGRKRTTAEVVGVVADLQEGGLDQPKGPEVFLSAHQMRKELSPSSAMQLLVRSDLPPIAVARAVRREVLALDPEQPTADLKTMEGVLAEALARRRLTATLLAAFTATALALCLVGIYGVVAHAVSLRRREIGVRMALGAGTRAVLATVAGQGLSWVAAGLALGVAAALALSRLLAGQLFEVSPTDPVQLAGAPLVLGAVALLACYLPARRALRVDPAITLRAE